MDKQLLTQTEQRIVDYFFQVGLKSASKLVEMRLPVLRDAEGSTVDLSYVPTYTADSITSPMFNEQTGRFRKMVYSITRKQSRFFCYTQCIPTNR